MYLQGREGRRAGGLVHHGGGTGRGISLSFLGLDPLGGRQAQGGREEQHSNKVDV